MVTKKIKNPNRSASKAVRIAKLSDYIVRPQTENAQEKCVYQGSRGFVFAEDHEGRKEEMLSLATACVRSRDPISHYIFTWQAGERPTLEQIEGLVDVFIREMGVDGHQLIYGLHGDTDNYHVHIELNRVSPLTEHVVEINKGYDIEVCHYVVQLVEEAQGWAREPDARYRIRDEGGRVIRVGDRTLRPSSKALEFENRTGARSAERIAQQDVAPIMLSSKSWNELHEGLSRLGVQFIHEGSGAKLKIGEEYVKASKASRQCSFARLEASLGPFQAADAGDIQARKPEPAAAEFSSEWNKFRTAKAEHNARKEALRSIHDEVKNALTEKQRRELEDIRSRNWHGKEIELELLLSVVASQHAKATAHLTDSQKREYRTVAPFPDFNAWLEREDPLRADQWRHRTIATPEQWGAFIAPQQKAESPEPRDIRSFVAFVDEKRRLVEYRRQGDRLSAFVDRGGLIDVRSCRDEAAMLGAMQLAFQKWGVITVKGSPEFTEACVRLAVKHNVKIANPELQTSILNEEIRLGKNKTVPQSVNAQVKSDSVPHPTPEPVKDAEEAFLRHRDHILKSAGVGRKPNSSSVDWIIAIRMRATQHSRSEVEKVLRLSAEKRPNDLRDSVNYAKKTANQVFGERGKREMEKFSVYRNEWLMIEGRSIAQSVKVRSRNSRSPRDLGRN